MKKMKKMFLLLGIFVLLFAGCDNTFTPVNTDGTPVTAKEPGMVRIYVGDADNNARTLQPYHENLEGYQLTFDVQQTRTVVVEMFDSYSDGWDHNGALNVIINGTSIPNIRLASGSYGRSTFTVNSGDVVSVYWTGNTGSYHVENSFIFYYEDTPPDPAFTSSNNDSWNGSNALLVRLQGSLSNANLNQLLGSFTLPPPTPDPVNIPTGNYADVYLADGEYTITAKAYSLGGIIGNPADEAASGSVTGIVVSAGTVTSNDGVIPPIILSPSGDGEGELNYEITLGDALPESYMVYYEIDETEEIEPLYFDGDYPEDIAAGNFEIPAGRYVVEIKLFYGNGEIAHYYDVVEIWRGIVTDIIFAPDVYIDPGLGLAYSGSTLSESGTTFDGNSIEDCYTSGTGTAASNARTYTITIDDFANVTFVPTLDSSSQYADISWFANTGSIPIDSSFHKTAITDFSESTTLWVKIVSEDSSSTTYYRFNI